MRKLAVLFVLCGYLRADPGDRFQALGTNVSVGLAEDNVIGPGPTPGSQRLYLDYCYLNRRLPWPATFEVVSAS